MILKHYIQILLFFICTMEIASQAGDLSLFSSGGGMTAVNDRYLSYSIGEPCINEVLTSGQWVTAGFQQPDAIDLTTSIMTVDGKYTIDIFPNPVSSTLFIKGNTLPACDAQVIDITGRVMQSNSIGSGEVNEILLTQLPAGLYYLHFIHRQETLASTPFIKNQTP